MAEGTELGVFLRTRREQLQPVDVGLPAAGRRRTPGLRREEVAALAGVSMDYLVRLEQGRDRNPSMAVISALADALRLDGDERDHLQRLAACAGAPDLCPRGLGPVDEVPATVRVLLDRLHPSPAVLLGPWFQVLAHNDAWERVMRPVGMLDHPEPNLARFTFCDERAQALYPAWGQVADEQVAVLRDAVIRWRGDDRAQALLDELLGVAAFAERWGAQPVARKRRGTKVVRHPDAGDLRIDYEVLHLDDGADQRIVTWLPADDATAASLHGLVSERLRLVGG